MKPPTRDELLAEITKACKPQLPPPDPGFTLEELAKEWKVGVGEARRRIKDAGMGIVKGRRWRIDAAGRRIADTVYRAA